MVLEENGVLKWICSKQTHTLYTPLLIVVVMEDVMEPTEINA
jgi:hypothetical protein